jgi:uncharacterized repeat protein (TIGR01451 family)
MKRFLIYLLLVCASASQAQTLVDIPDSNFRKALKDDYSDLMVGDKLNVALAEQVYVLNVESKLINSLVGIQFFKNLTTINCRLNQLTSLPELPSTVEVLECSNNELTSLPKLSNSLNSLSCSDNLITSLPELPNSLTYLSCSFNLLPILPKLPITLKFLIIGNNQLTSLQELPSGLQDLSCNNNLLTNLPEIPGDLTTLDCSNNKLTTLPELPKKLYSLSCYANLLTRLPELSSSLQILTCNHNLLTSLPELPSGLFVLDCNNNKLKILPELPNSLGSLNCNDNPNLFCLPLLPNSLITLYYGSNITCVPNKPFSLIWDVPSICNPTNNKNNCEAYSIISGIVYNDNNNNGIKEPDESPRKGVKVTLQPSGQSTFTNYAGYYEITVDSLKTYTISVEVPSFFFSSTQYATITFIGEQITKDFSLQKNKNVKDLSATLTPLLGFARPGFSLPLVFEVENRGNNTENGTAYVELPNDYILDYTSISSTNGLFNFTNINPGEVIKMMVYGHVATTATLGDTLKFKGIVNIYDYMTDSVYSNNISELKLIIRGSFDPNDKQGPGYVTPKQVQNGDFIEYTIRFQNTGTDTAFTVVIADTLTSNLLPETLEMISTSHNCKTTVKGNQIYFEFLNILLPDSNTNEVKSHGYVRFKVKPKNTLKLGQSILNTASIYFDYNKPVVTNTVNTKVDEPLLTGIQTVSISSNGLAYPNPVENGRLFVSNSKGLKFKLNNAQGQLMMNGTVDETGLDVSQLNPGMYMLEIGANENRKVEKIVIR